MLSDQTQKVGPLAGNGSTTTFSFSPMIIFASTDIEVYHVVTATGVETLLSEGTGANAYAVNLTTYPNTGTITYPEDEVTPIPSTEAIVIKRVLTEEQPIDLENQGGYNPETLERQLDKIVMMILQLQEEVDRCIKFPITNTDMSSVDTDKPAALQHLRINATNDGVEWVDP